ncbi:hypothetical protein CRYUN_Cryun16bG0032800 [Craigia yunnanensis]
MPGFYFRHFLMHRSQIMGRCLRAMKVKLTRKRRVNRRARRSLRAMQLAAVEIEMQNWRVRRENELMFVTNTLIDQLVHDLLVEFENKP